MYWNPSSYSSTSHSHIFCIFQLCELYRVQVHHITVLNVLVLPMYGARITRTEDLGAVVVPMEAPFLIFWQWYLTDFFNFFLCYFGHIFHPFYIEICPKPKTIISLELQNKKRVSKMNFWANTKLMSSFNMCTGTFKFCLLSTGFKSTAEVF